MLVDNYLGGVGVDGGDLVGGVEREGGVAGQHPSWPWPRPTQACRADLDEVRSEVRAEYEAEFVDANRDALRALLPDADL